MADNPSVVPRRGYDTDGFEQVAAPVAAYLVERALASVVELESDRAARRRAGASLRTAASGLQRIVMTRPGPAVAAIIEVAGLGDAARRALGCDEPVVWGVEQLTKPPGEKGAIGWHQDRPYFDLWQGPTATAWVALTEMTEDSGTVRYVIGSHRWGGRYGTADFDRTPSETRRVGPPAGASWTEVAVVGPSGTAVLHHPGTVHGSGPNRTARPRRALAIRLRSSETVLRPDTPASIRRAMTDIALGD